MRGAGLVRRGTVQETPLPDRRLGRASPEATVLASFTLAQGSAR